MNTQQPTTVSKRITSIDIVKGIAIILVVYGHVMQGMSHRNLLYMPFYTFSDTLIYSFHMPAFFFASGLFAKLNSNTSTTLITKKAQQILWPYLLWELINLLTSPFVSQYTMAGAHALVFKDVLVRIALGTGSWFLWTLFVVYVIAIATRQVERKLLLMLSLVSYFAVYYLGTILPGSVYKIFIMLPYFVFSSRWADEIMHYLSLLENSTTKNIKRKTLIPVLFSAAFLISSVAILTNFKVPTAVLIPVKLLMGLAGTFLLTFIAASLTPFRIGGVLTKVGIASLGIFLLHPYFQGLSRLVVTHLTGEANPMTILLSVLVQTIAGVWGAFIVYFKALRYGGSWLFHFPQQIKTKVPALSKAS